MQAGLAPICQIIANMRHASAPKNVLGFVPSIQPMHPRQLDPAKGAAVRPDRAAASRGLTTRRTK